MPAKPAGDQELVGICMTEVCRKAGLTNTGNLVQRDLKFLADSIDSKTGVLISVSTIKRLLNGQFSRLPQVATLDALAQFLDYPGWQQFKRAQNPADTVARKDSAGRDYPAEPPRASASPRKKAASARVLLLMGLLILATLGLFAVIKIHRPGLANIEKARFSVVKVTSNDLPNTVVFRYNIDSVTADSFFIQQSWDINRRVRIYKKSYTLTDIYYEPGYHNAKLIANNQVIKTLPVSIPTDRWFFFVKDKLPKSKPSYLFTAKGIKDGALQLTPADLAEARIDTRQENVYELVYFPSAFGSSSDNFDFSFRIKMTPLGNVACPYIMPEIFCQQNFMYFISTLKGCASELKTQFGDTYLNGKTNDLSALGSDVRTWQNMEVSVKDKHVSIRINGVEALSSVYRQSCGSITGLGFISNGLCAVDSVNLRTTDGKSIYRNDFE